ncbi:MAG: aryl-sulfate sulfotransferase [Candidatus Omnitrophica bacterium]|nr:aryl-sulfate sulfotransferase [Candidatus Omnitrophota bacterium]
MISSNAQRAIKETSHLKSKIAQLPMFKIIPHLRLSRFFSFTLLSIISFCSPSQCAPTSEIQDESLFSLPYIEYVKTEQAPGKAGTTIYKKDKAFPGYNLYTSDMIPDGFVHLIDMDGALIHKWAKNPQSEPFLWTQVTPFPNGSIFLTNGRGGDPDWHRSSLITDGQGGGLDWQLVDATSRPISTYDIPGQEAHHAAYYFKEGGFLGLVRNKIALPYKDLAVTFWDNSLIQVSPNGKPIKTILLSKLFANDPRYKKKLEMAYQKYKKDLEKRQKKKARERLPDFFHANNIERLEWDIPGIAKKGSWLVSVRNFNSIIIIDPDKEAIIWKWGEGIIDMVHDASFLKPNNILLFDNGHKKSSRVIELDMKSREIVWQYGRKPGQDLYSRLRGAAQRLPNGNVLITESDKGHVIEVTDSGEIVWEWYSDFFKEGPHTGKRRAIRSMKRFPYNYFQNVQFNYGKNQLPIKDQ